VRLAGLSPRTESQSCVDYTCLWITYRGTRDLKAESQPSNHAQLFDEWRGDKHQIAVVQLDLALR